MTTAPAASPDARRADVGSVAFVMTGELYRNSRALKQIRSLAAAGYRVDVWHLPGSAAAVGLPAGVAVHEVPRPAGGGPLFFRKVHRLFVEALRSANADIMHASDLYALPACRRRADENRSALTYDAREYYPHVAGTVGKPWARWWWRRMEGRHIGRADTVFTVSDSIADALAADYGIQRPAVVHNAPPVSGASPDPDVPTLSSIIGTSDPIVVHLGQMKAHRGGSSLIQAMTGIHEAHLVFLGYGSEKGTLQQLTHSLGLGDRVHFVDPVPPDAIRATIRDAKVGVTMLEDTCLNHRFALPNKLFDYVHAGIPVLGSDLDEVRKVISDFDIGVTAPADNPDDIARALRSMLDPELQARWRSSLPAAAETFTWESASQRLLDGFHQALVAGATLKKDPSA